MNIFKSTHHQVTSQVLLGPGAISVTGPWHVFATNWSMADLRRADGLGGPLRSQGMFGNSYGGRPSHSDSPTFNRPFLPNTAQGHPPPHRPNLADQTATQQDTGSSKISRIQKKLQRVKAMNHKLSDVVPESKLILQLVEMERRIAAECERTKCELEDLNSAAETATQTLRVTIFNTHRSLQSERINVGNEPADQISMEGVDQSNNQPGKTDPSNSWTLHISCSLVNSECELRRSSDASKPVDFGLDKYFDKVKHILGRQELKEPANSRFFADNC